jgi:hypothetical protein
VWIASSLVPVTVVPTGNVKLHQVRLTGSLWRAVRGRSRASGRSGRGRGTARSPPNTARGRSGNGDQPSTDPTLPRPHGRSPHLTARGARGRSSERRRGRLREPGPALFGNVSRSSISWPPPPRHTRGDEHPRRHAAAVGGSAGRARARR